MAARRTYNVPLAVPPLCVKVAVLPQVELSLETSKLLLGRVAVMLAVRPVPETLTLEELEAVP